MPTGRSAFRNQARRGEDTGVRRERVMVPRPPSTLTGDRCEKQLDRSRQRGVAPQPPHSTEEQVLRGVKGQDLSDLGVEPRSRPLQADCLPFEPPGKSLQVLLANLFILLVVQILN